MQYVRPIEDLEEVRQFKDYLKNKNLRDYCLCVMGLNIGLRIMELLAIRVLDVVDEFGNIKELLRLKKNGETKEYPLNEVVVSSIKEYLAARKKYLLKEPLFLSKKNGAAIQRQHVYKSIHDAAVAVGIKGSVGGHTLRKTWGYHAFLAGIDIRKIMNHLGYMAPEPTYAYLGISSKQIQEMDNRMFYMNF